MRYQHIYEINRFYLEALLIQSFPCLPFNFFHPSFVAEYLQIMLQSLIKANFIDHELLHCSERIPSYHFFSFDTVINMLIGSGSSLINQHNPIVGSSTPCLNYD